MMTSNAARSEMLVRALRASLDHDRALIDELYTDDVKAWTPSHATSSADELAHQIERRDDAFSDAEIEVVPLDVGGDFACAEWSVTMTHSGPLVLGDGAVVEPTGLQITLNGVTVAEFRGDRICSLREYWDELSVLDQLGLLPDEREVGSPSTT
jgi:ketosteroid isomerase-like protein